jgi:hypothetical protein
MHMTFVANVWLALLEDGDQRLLLAVNELPHMALSHYMEHR